MQQFFYDEQIRRFLLQFTRVFSNFQIEYGTDDSGISTLYRVPVRYGDSSRQAQSVLQNNSANSMPATPLMSFYITQLKYARDRVQEPYHVNRVQVRQRTWDPDNETYETTQGNAFTVERLMPVPYNLEITLDIWTSNTNQKLQLLEQVLTLFNPSLEVQGTDNFIDWSSLSVIELVDVNWSSRTIPQGTDTNIDIATLRFVLPIWISSPAKIKKLGVIEKIVSSIFNANGDAANAVVNNNLLLGTREIITPFGYKILLLDGQIQLLPRSATVSESTNFNLTVPATDPGSTISWPELIAIYPGNIRPGISQIRFADDRVNNEIVGTVVIHPSDTRFLLFSVDPDTLPSNTLDAIDAIVNPLSAGPLSGLPAAVVGQRYLLISNIGNTDNLDPSKSWGDLVAKANDIIEYDGVSWNVSFVSLSVTGTQYVTNLITGIQYAWIDQTWIKSYQGVYQGGNWSLVF